VTISTLPDTPVPRVIRAAPVVRSVLDESIGRSGGVNAVIAAGVSAGVSAVIPPVIAALPVAGAAVNRAIAAMPVAEAPIATAVVSTALVGVVATALVAIALVATVSVPRHDVTRPDVTRPDVTVAPVDGASAIEVREAVRVAGAAIATVVIAGRRPVAGWHAIAGASVAGAGTADETGPRAIL
jgi:hypothetical protein